MVQRRCSDKRRSMRPHPSSRESLHPVPSQSTSTSTQWTRPLPRRKSLGGISAVWRISILSWAETRRPSLTFALRRDLLLPLQGSQRQSGYAAPRHIPPPLPRYAPPPVLPRPLLSSRILFLLARHAHFLLLRRSCSGMECNNLSCIFGTWGIQGEMTREIDLPVRVACLPAGKGAERAMGDIPSRRASTGRAGASCSRGAASC